MWTTLANPALWLLAATAAIAVAGALRRETARQSLDRLVGIATALPVLIPFIALAIVSAGARAVVGYQSPNLGSEQAEAINRFLHERRTDPPTVLGEFRAWNDTSRPAPPPWTPIAGVTDCPAEAMGQRVRLFTPHAHSPLLLVAGAPFVRAGGERLLTGALITGALAGAVALTFVLVRSAGLTLSSRSGLLLSAAVLGWQPVLAGMRQADGALMVAALVAWAWFRSGRRRSVAAAVSTAAAVCLNPAAAGTLPGVWRRNRSTGILATLLVISVLGAAVLYAGFNLLPGLFNTFTYASRAYSLSPLNYSFAGRMIADGAPAAVVILGLLAAVTAVCLVSRRPDPMPLLILIGLLTAPLLWSQHLALLCVPLVALAHRAIRARSSGVLAAAAALVMLFSLPDPATSFVNRYLGFPFSETVGVPPGVVALGLLCVWLAIPENVETHHAASEPVPVTST